jgi:CHASE3 domain sensor protein
MEEWKEKEERKRNQIETIIKKARRKIRSGFRDLLLLLHDPEYERKQSEVRKIIQKTIQEADGKLWRARLRLALDEKDPREQKEKLARLFPGAGKRLKSLNKAIEKKRRIEEKIADQLSLLDK